MQPLTVSTQIKLKQHTCYLIEFNCQLTAWKNGVITAMSTMEVVANTLLSLKKELKYHVDKGFDNSESTPMFCY